MEHAMNRPWFHDVAAKYPANARSRVLQLAIGALIGGSIVLVVLFVLG
jgi:hypothetical protein